ncbi:uncharacterized protein LOC124357559 isoform X3 [Homalodisca vitripennis]|uniref:uncharacterized protein LOC124357559 isoform X3 n=1 Tax=Homalodisca vitripennis TaxID=197043 RepID=UPI001EEBC40E|nr:uncharacterized protein LOC124357559 isoform X3 [Homalodisca vitripennis]
MNTPHLGLVTLPGVHVCMRGYWDCCDQLECTLGKRSDGLVSFVFFCSDPMVNETANIDGLNSYLFWHPEAHPEEENMSTGDDEF